MITLLRDYFKTYLSAFFTTETKAVKAVFNMWSHFYRIHFYAYLQVLKQFLRFIYIFQIV